MSKIMFVRCGEVVNLQIVNDAGVTFSLSGLPVPSGEVPNVLAGKHYAEVDAARFDDKDYFEELPLRNEPEGILQALASHLGFMVVNDLGNTPAAQKDMDALARQHDEFAEALEAYDDACKHKESGCPGTDLTLVSCVAMEEFKVSKPGVRAAYWAKFTCKVCGQFWESEFLAKPSSPEPK